MTQFGWLFAGRSRRYPYDPDSSDKDMFPFKEGVVAFPMVENSVPGTFMGGLRQATWIRQEQGLIAGYVVQNTDSVSVLWANDITQFVAYYFCQLAAQQVALASMPVEFRRLLMAALRAKSYSFEERDTDIIRAVQAIKQADEPAAFASSLEGATLIGQVLAACEIWPRECLLACHAAFGQRAINAFEKALRLKLGIYDFLGGPQKTTRKKKAVKE